MGTSAFVYVDLGNQEYATLYRHFDAFLATTGADIAIAMGQSSDGQSLVRRLLSLKDPRGYGHFEEHGPTTRFIPSLIESDAQFAYICKPVSGDRAWAIEVHQASYPLFIGKDWKKTSFESLQEIVDAVNDDRRGVNRRIHQHNEKNPQNLMERIDYLAITSFGVASISPDIPHLLYDGSQRPIICDAEDWGEVRQTEERGYSRDILTEAIQLELLSNGGKGNGFRTTDVGRRALLSSNPILAKALEEEPSPNTSVRRAGPTAGPGMSP